MRRPFVMAAMCAALGVGRGTPLPYKGGPRTVPQPLTADDYKRPKFKPGKNRPKHIQRRKAQ